MSKSVNLHVHPSAKTAIFMSNVKAMFDNVFSIYFYFILGGISEKEFKNKSIVCIYFG